MKPLSHMLACAMLTLFAAGCGGQAIAQAGGGTQGRIVAGNAPGGATDIVARLLAPGFSAALGHNFVVDNRPGASGNIAAEFVAKAPADGNTILLIFNSHTTIGPLFPKLPFDPIRDFAAVGLIAETPYMVVARPGLGVDNLRDLVARAKRTREPISAGSPGRGTPQHLLFERVNKVHDMQINTIHYKGSAPAQSDVLGGHIDLTLVSPSLGGPLVKAGKLLALAVTSEARLADFPNVQTVREAGVDALASTIWLGLLVPAKTPRATVTQLNRILNDTLKAPDTAARLKAIGMTPVGGTPEAQDRTMAEEQAVWTTLIRDLKITID